jgi:hypothetical protein
MTTWCVKDILMGETQKQNVTLGTELTVVMTVNVVVVTVINHTEGKVLN